MNITKPIIKREKKETFLEVKIQYLKNCLFWMNEYIEGRQNKKQLSHTITAIKKHCLEIRTKLLL